MKTQQFVLASLLFAALLGFAPGVRAGNPLVGSIGLTDPHGVVYGDRVYLYATHDASAASKKFVMTNWWVWSSADLVDWKMEGTLDPKDTFIGKPFNSCWATFGATRNGKYYWYYSAGPTQIGVVQSDRPAGPWHDPLGQPLVPEGLVPTASRDPDILMDDDGQAYMVFGTFDFYLVRLNEDMISLAEKPRPILLDHKFGPYGEGKTDDKPSLHKRNGIYYLSWSSYYATATNPYGPYTYKGTVIEPENVAADFQTEKLHHDRHGNFFTFRNQDYYVFNDKSQPGTSDRFRDACMAYVHYRANGDIAPIRLNRIGVGQYDAAQGIIEAENFFSATNIAKKEISGGFGVQAARAGGFLIYPNVHGLKNCSQISLQFSSTKGGGGFEISEGGLNGPLLAVAQIPESAESSDQPQMVTVPFQRHASGDALCVKFLKVTPATLDAIMLSR